MKNEKKNTQITFVKFDDVHAKATAFSSGVYAVTFVYQPFSILFHVIVYFVYCGIICVVLTIQFNCLLFEAIRFCVKLYCPRFYEWSTPVHVARFRFYFKPEKRSSMAWKWEFKILQVLFFFPVKREEEDSTLSSTECSFDSQMKWILLNRTHQQTEHCSRIFPRTLCVYVLTTV